MRLHNEGTNRSRSVLEDTSHQVVNPAFSQDENIDAALRTEHAAIARGLEALYQAVLSGAKLDVVSDVVWTVQSSCIARFVQAEQILRDSGFGGLKKYTAVRRRFLRSLNTAHRAVREGKVEATLDIADVLSGFVEHIDQLLNPYFARQQGVRRAGAIQ